MQSKKSQKHNILIVDDHQIVAHGLQALLSREDCAKSIDAAHTAEKALQLSKKKNYGIYIIDVELPDISGLELAEQLQAISPASSLIFHTMHEEIWTIKAMMAAGADAIVLKSDDLSDLTAAVKAVATGDSYYSRRFEDYCRKFESRQIPSPQELDILRAIAKGESTNDIARRMCISPNTIEYHRKRLFRKLGATNMADMVARAIEHGLLVI